MKRRAFLGIIPAAFAGLTFRGFQTPKLAFKNGKASVSWYLTQLYNQKAKGTSKHPKYVFVSEWLRDRYESELTTVQRFVSHDPRNPNYTALCFKTCKLEASYTLSGWDVVML